MPSRPTRPADGTSAGATRAPETFKRPPETSSRAAPRWGRSSACTTVIHVFSRVLFSSAGSSSVADVWVSPVRAQAMEAARRLRTDASASVHSTTRSSSPLKASVLN